MTERDPVHDDNSSSLPAAEATGFWRYLPGIGRLLERMELLSEKRHERQHLRELTDEGLEDIGVSRAAARREADRHFWE